MLEDSPMFEAITLWEQLTGVSPPDAKGFWGTGAGMNTWAIRDTYTALKEALELDPTEVTASLLFKTFIEEYLRSATTSMMTMLKDPSAAMKQLETAKRLLEIVDREEIVVARDAFVAGLNKALAKYGADQRADIQAVLNDHAMLAILRRDALRSLSRLRVDQFLEGENEGPDYTPVYVNQVHLWWNINSLLKAATSGMPSGVSLNLIRDPNAYESYFAFSIRNGGNLFVLTDVPERAHPMQAEMVRKPGRDFDRRASKNWFPYDLLGMKVDEKGDSCKPAHSDETAVAAYQPDTIPMMKIAELPPHETIWITMMLDLIVTKFWKVGFKAKEISYTGEMIKVESILLLEAARAGLPAVLDNALVMPELTLADVTGDGLDDKQIGKQYDSPNRWLEERYAPQIVTETLNLLAGPGEVRKLALPAPGAKNALAPKVQEYGALENDDHDERGMRLWSDDRAKRELQQAQMRTMSVTKFGTPAELEADRRWLARYNVAQQVRILAKREFAERETEVKAWYTKRVLANLPTLLTWINSEHIWLNEGKYGSFDRNRVGGFLVHLDLDEDESEKDTRGEKKRRTVRMFMRKHDLTIPSSKLDLMDLAQRWGGINLGGWRQVNRSSGHPTCVVNQAKASMQYAFRPSQPEHLAALCGCKVEELPDVLQHWYLADPYRGNSILDRIDPMIWRVDNPWAKLDLTVRIPLSHSGRAKIAKGPKGKPSFDTLMSDEDFEKYIRPRMAGWRLV